MAGVELNDANLQSCQIMAWSSIPRSSFSQSGSLVLANMHPSYLLPSISLQLVIQVHIAVYK